MNLRGRMTLAVAATVAVAVVAGLTASQITARNQLRLETDRFLLGRVSSSVHQEPFGAHYSDDRPGGDESPLVEFDAVTQYIDANGKVVGSIAVNRRCPSTRMTSHWPRRPDPHDSVTPRWAARIIESSPRRAPTVARSRWRAT